LTYHFKFKRNGIHYFVLLGIIALHRDIVDQIT